MKPDNNFRRGKRSRVFKHAHFKAIRYLIPLFILSVLILSSYFRFVKGDPGPAAVLKLSLPAGTYQSVNPDPWLSEGWLLNVTSSSGTLTLRINNTSSSIVSYDSHLIIALNNASYNNLVSLSVNSTAIPKTAFVYGTPKPYGVWTWPSGDVYPTWFADPYVFGTLYPKGYKDLIISVTFLNAAGSRMHFDAYGSEITPPPPPGPGKLTHNGISEDSTVLFSPPPTQQFYLTVKTDPAGIVTIPGQGWYSKSTNVTLTSPTTVPNMTGVRYRFSYWDVDGPSQGIGVNLITAQMNANHTATAHYVKQYYLTVSSPYGTTGGADWYDNGVTAYAMVTPLTVLGPSGVQYVFTNWSVDATGTTSPSNPIIMNAPKTATANWKTQCYLTVGNGGRGTATGEGWYDAGSSASFSISPTTVSGGTGTQYVFTGWVGSGVGSYTGPDVSRSVTMNNPITENAQWKTQYLVSFTQTGSAVAPNVNYTADIDPVSPVPFDVWVKAGSQIVYEYQSIVLGPTGTRYVFVSTDPASPQTVNGPLAITGTYKTQYYLIVNTNPAEVLTLNPAAVSGQGWYDSGDTATVDAVQNVDKVADQSRYDFRTWAGATPTGVGNKASVLMNGPKTATANYQLQYKITFNQSGVGSDFPGTVVKIDGTNYGVVSPPTLPYSFWWDNSASHTFAFQSPLVVTANSKQYVWTSTTGLSTLESGSITVSSAGIVTGNYKTQYSLTATSPYGSPTPTSGWLDAGSQTASVTSPSPGPAGTQYVCIGCTGTGSVPPSGTGSTATFTLNAPSSITWNWKTQYYLTVKTSPSGIVTIHGEGWYDASASVSLTAPSVAGYNFTNWDVDGVSQGAGVASISVTMNAPHIATAHYTRVQPPAAVPVGGHSIALIKQIPTSSLIEAYVMLIAMFSAMLSLVRRKRKW